MILYEDEKIKVVRKPTSTLVEVKPGTSMLEAMAKYPEYMQPNPPKHITSENDCQI